MVPTIATAIIVLSGFGQGTQAKPARPPGVAPAAQSKAMVKLPVPAFFSAKIGSQAHPNDPNPVQSDSADGAYNQNGQGDFVVEAQNTTGLRLQLAAVWGDKNGSPRPPTPMAASSSFVEATFYGFDGQWRRLGSVKAHCGFRENNAILAICAKGIEHCPYSKVRVFGRAWVQKGYGANERRTYGKVTCLIRNLEW